MIAVKESIMFIAVTKEAEAGEKRVALVPDTVAKLVKQGLKIQMEAGAGKEAFFSDESYSKAGAEVLADGTAILKNADILVKINPLIDTDLLKEGSVVIGLLNPSQNLDFIQKLASRKITAFAMEKIPRISRAQGMDVLSSQAAVAGYKAVLLAANKLPKFFPMLTTAAGTIFPAKVLVIGAGVAGLQAIATAKRLGALVEAFDIRPETKQEIESVGGKFAAIKLEDKDVVITAAQVPGKKAPLLVTEEMILKMKEGSVIVDLAAEQGGNSVLTEPGKEVVKNGVTIMGPLHVPSMIPTHASQMYSKNIASFLGLIIKDGNLNLDFQDEIIAATCVTHEGILK